MESLVDSPAWPKIVQHEKPVIRACCTLSGETLVGPQGLLVAGFLLPVHWELLKNRTAHDMDTDTNPTPANPEAPKPSVGKQIGSGLKVGLVIIFLLVMTGMVYDMLSADTPKADPAPVVAAAPTDGEIYIDAKAIITKALKAPSTAKFPSSSYATITRYSDGYKVSSYVDSQNGFGAMLRSDWSVVFTYVGDQVEVHQVVLDGDELYRKAGE